jgi:hypothetical protein
VDVSPSRRVDLVMGRVMGATGEPLRRLLREPFAATLWTFYRLAEEEERGTLAARARSIDQAYYNRFAFMEPDDLQSAARKLDADVKALAAGDSGDRAARSERERLIAGALALDARIRRAEAEGTLKVVREIVPPPVGAMVRPGGEG